ncbi:hypothetical protein [Candidatus Nitrosotalea bavarica]|uniref:hypothetical protein n=1 Tax=Candidatus Nitrosotalea bavarica TaxID=1903277 RepID=UPI000C706F29|nr:hypothetical protein [Candidatus Nitrosotalea bavarica]
MLKESHLLENRPKLFAIVIFTVIAVFAVPVILPHVFHEFQVFHILLHLSGVAIASFLTIVSTLAYTRIRTKRLMFTMIAFGLFAVAEVFSVIDAAWQYTYYFGSVSADEVGHILELCTLGMFALSVFRRD